MDAPTFILLVVMTLFWGWLWSTWDFLGILTMIFVYGATSILALSFIALSHHYLQHFNQPWDWYFLTHIAVLFSMPIRCLVQASLEEREDELILCFSNREERKKKYYRRHGRRRHDDSYYRMSEYYNRD
jgi:hypothetical protein